METATQLVSLEGHTALISGAASGIGEAMAKRFADAGAKLLLLDVEEGKLAQVAQDLRESFRATVSTFPVNLANHSEIAELWQQVSDSPDILVNNAGIYPMRAFADLAEDFVEHTFRVNLMSVLWMCQGFIKRRQEQGGTIVNVSSVEAIMPFKKDMVHYSTSKASVIALTRALARDYGRAGFRVNVVIPGAIRTPSTMRLIREAVCHCDVHLMKTGYDFQSRLAMGRWGHPDEVARVALFLASPLASYVHGAMVPVDGGFLSS